MLTDIHFLFYKGSGVNAAGKVDISEVRSHEIDPTR